jgi:hypothetical protein
MGPRSPEGIAAVTRTIQAVNARGKNRHFAPRGDGHGVYAATRVQPATQALAAEILAILDGEGLGHIRPADRVTAELLATTLRRVHQAEAYLDRTGLVAKGGTVRPLATLLVSLLREARAFCETLGMTPSARAKLGLDTARTFDVAAALAAIPGAHHKGGTPTPPHPEETPPGATGEAADGPPEA